MTEFDYIPGIEEVDVKPYEGDPDSDIVHTDDQGRQDDEVEANDA